MISVCIIPMNMISFDILFDNTLARVSLTASRAQFAGCDTARHRRLNYSFYNFIDAEFVPERKAVCLKGVVEEFAKRFLFPTHDRRG
jgi:hypothetical protein